METRWLDEELEGAFRELEVTIEHRKARQGSCFMWTCWKCHKPGSMFYILENDTWRCLACRVRISGATGETVGA